MKASFIFFSLMMVISACSLGRKPEEKTILNDSTTREVYDSLLAQKLGADDYGMKTYVMAFLKRGPTPPSDSLERVHLQRAHLDNITRLAEEGKLILAGPFLDNGPLRGIYIFDVQTLEEAEALTSTDPAIVAGSLVMELHPWYGPAALPEIINISRKISKEGI